MFDIYMKIMSIFYEIAMLDAEYLSEDSCIWMEWLHFNNIINVELKKIYLFVKTIINNFISTNRHNDYLYSRRKEISSFSFLYKPYKTTGKVAIDGVAYLCHLNAAQAYRISK